MKEYLRLVLSSTMIALTVLLLNNCKEETLSTDPVEFTVTFNMDGGAPAVKAKIIKEGKALAKPTPDPKKAGHDFAGWYGDAGFKKAFDFAAGTIAENTTLYAKWDIITYTVTFDYNDGGGGVGFQKKVNHGEKVNEPNPTRTGYIFLNWYSNTALTTVFDPTTGTITQDTALYAKWDPLTYTVTFNYNDGGTDSDLQQQVKHDQKVNDPKPTRTGYTFSNWHNNSTLTSVFDPATGTITQDTTLYAKWGIHTYTVTFNYNDGGTTTDLQQPVNYEQPVNAPKPTRTGYTFASWHSDRALVTVFDPTTPITQNTILYAKWDTLTHTVTFNYNDGGTATDLQQQVNYDQQVSDPKPIRTGYTFLNWYSNTALTAVFDPTTGTITQDTILYAKWDTLAHTVTFNYNDGGTATDLQQQVSHDQQVSDPQPTRTGYTFANWYSNSALTTVFDPTTSTIIQDTTLYAKWTISTYTVVFNYNNGGTTTDLQQQVNYDQQVSDPKPTRTGYTFSKWYSNSTLTTVFDPTTSTITQDTTLYAKWDTLVYTVNFNYNDGGTTTDLQQQVNYDQQVTDPKPTRTGYTFSSWYSDRTLATAFDPTTHVITRDTTLYAKWTISTYTVVFNYNDGGTTTDLQQQVNYDQQVSASEPTRTGYTFANWCSNAALTTVFDMTSHTITQDTTLYAKWDTLAYTVTFNYNDGGTATDLQQQVNYDQQVTDPKPTRTGYTFANWYSNAALTTVFDVTSHTITQDTTLYAKWTINTYTVTFNYNDGGTATDLQQQVNYDQQVSASEPTRTGYTFANWCSNVALTAVFDMTSHTITQDTTLYAKWDTLAYTVTFNYNNGGTTTDLQQQVNYDQQVSDPKPTRTGYTFANWYSNATLTSVFDVTSGTITQDTTLYAKWDTLAYTVTFNYNDGGTATDLQQQVNHDQKVSAPKPTRTGYTFANWYSNATLTTVFDVTSHTITQDTTLYAKWDTLAYTVTFNYNDGGTVTDLQQQVNYDQRVSDPKPIRTGYTFANWYSNATLTAVFDVTSHTITQDTTLYAGWDTLAYTVTFNYNDGGTATDLQQQVNHDQKVSDPKPTKAGYTFSGWCSNTALTTVFDVTSHTITQDTTLYAKWDTLTYTVTFNYNNGGTATDLQKEVKEGKKVAVTKPTKTGYTFSSWYSDVTLNTVFDPATDTITQDTTLYAKWTINTYTVTFNYNDGGSGVDFQKQFQYEQHVGSYNPDRKGYTFVYWYKDSTLRRPFDVCCVRIIQDVTIYAKWTINTYTVTFNYNDGGTATDLQQKLTYGKLSTVPKPTKAGYTLSNWYSDATLNTVFDPATDTISQDITLYAKWDAITYTVTFNYNDGGTTPDLQKEVQEGDKVADPKPTKKGYSLLDWYSDSTLTTVFDPTTDTITQDTSLYAKWESHLVYIPDLNFRNRLKAVLSSSFVGDSLHSTDDPVKQLNNLSVGFSNIQSLEGIQYFKNMQGINLAGNSVTNLDLSQNTRLSSLDCHNNQLDSLNLSAHTELTILRCHNNSNPSLTSLDIRGMRSVIALGLVGVNQTVVLETLKVHENIKNHSSIKNAKSIRGNNLIISTYSAAAGSTDYTLVCGHYNPNTGACLLVEIPDANFRARLKAMFPNAFMGDQLDTTNSVIKGLKTLNMSHSGADSTKINDLTGIQYFPNLEKLVLNNNNLTDLDVSKNTKLTWLELDDNQLDSLDVSNNTALTVLDFAGNSLTGIDLSRNTELIALTCYDNQLDSLDISNNTKIIALDCRDNGLSYLDMRGVRLPNIYSIQDTSDETNAIKTLKVHEKLKNESEVAAVKTAGGTIKTYRAAAGSTSYSLVCGNYNPTTGSCSSTP